MSMKYFTLSAVCMLIFCMLLALSGTSDFPGTHPEVVPQTGLVSPPPELNQSGKGQALASVYSVAEDSQSKSKTQDSTTTVEGTARNRTRLFLGLVFIAGWVLLSFKLLYNSKG